MGLFKRKKDDPALLVDGIFQGVNAKFDDLQKDVVPATRQGDPVAAANAWYAISGIFEQIFEGACKRALRQVGEPPPPPPFDSFPSHILVFGDQADAQYATYLRQFATRHRIDPKELERADARRQKYTSVERTTKNITTLHAALKNPSPPVGDIAQEAAALFMLVDELRLKKTPDSDAALEQAMTEMDRAYDALRAELAQFGAILSEPETCGSTENQWQAAGAMSRAGAARRRQGTAGSERSPAQVSRCTTWRFYPTWTPRPSRPRPACRSPR